MVASRRTPAGRGDEVLTSLPPTREFRGPGWYVVCEDYAAGPFKDEARAERVRAGIVNFAQCPHEHTVEEH